MQLTTRTIESAHAAEAHVTAIADPLKPFEQQWSEVFAGVRDSLAAFGAHIVQERVFARSGDLELIRRIRSDAYDELDDGVPPRLLVAPAGSVPQSVGAQVHAVRTDRPPMVLHSGNTTARILDADGLRYVAASGDPQPGIGIPSDQVRSLFEGAESLLRQAGIDLRCIARTWIWLDDILCWYGDFNDARTGFFTKRGLISGDPGECCLPASTGIGVAPANGASCGLDLIAVSGDVQSLEHLPAAGNQDSPVCYGSAFSRATLASTPAGQTLFISGTAAIDLDGRTIHRDDPEEQIAATVANVRRVMNDADCSDESVVQAIAYCKTAEVMLAWQTHSDRPDWPCLSVIADVCRDDLLFELEATACRQSR